LHLELQLKLPRRIETIALSWLGPHTYMLFRHVVCLPASDSVPA
jgi:hypothetical protein